MKIIGFNFTKVSAEKPKEFKTDSKVSTNIGFLGLEKEEKSLVKGDLETLQVLFNFSVMYGDTEKKEKTSDDSEISLTGRIMIVATKEETKLLLESWKEKKLPTTFQVPIFNFILRKCSVRALQLEEELNLPLHLPLPQLKAGKKEQKEEKKQD